MDDSRSPMLCLLSFAVALAVIAARPGNAAAQSLDPVPLDGKDLAQGSDREPARSLSELAAPNARIAFGVKRSGIQHVVATSPFDDVYAGAAERPELFTLETVHRFGQRGRGGAIRVLPPDPPANMRIEPGERPLRIGPYPPILWNLSDRVRIAFGGGVRSTPTIDAGLERPTVPLGSLAIEFGDRK